MDLNISLCDALGVSGCNRVIFSQVNINLPPLYRNVFRRDQRRFDFVTMVFPARLPAPTDGGVIRFISYSEWKKGKTSFLRVFGVCHSFYALTNLLFQSFNNF
jgi:hypothetical protein